MSKDEWAVDNAFARLDSEHQMLRYRQIIAQVRNGAARQLLDEPLEIIHPHELKREFAEEGGIWFVRTQNVRPMRIDRGNVVCLPTEVAAGLKRNTLRKNDILITRTGANRGDCALFDSDEWAVASSHTFIVRSSGWGHSYLMTFLNSSYGKAQIDKGAYGAAQPELAPYYLQRIWVPSASEKFQQLIGNLIARARDASHGSSQLLVDAESTLLDALGLRDWSQPETLAYTRSVGDVLEAGRLDAQYFQPAKTQMLARLCALGGKPLGESFDVIRELVDPKRDPSGLCRNYDVTDALQPVLDAAKEPAPFADIESQKVRMSDGDLAVSRLRAYLRQIAVVRVSDEVPTVGSSEFYVLRRKDNIERLSAEALMIFLRSAPVQTILKWCQDGSQHPRFAERDLMAIPLPNCVIELNETLTAKVRDALGKRSLSLRLLATAKLAVEISVQDSEESAFAFVERQGQVVLTN